MSTHTQGTLRLAAGGSSERALQRMNYFRVQSGGPMASRAIVGVIEQIYSGSRAMSTTGRNGWNEPQIEARFPKKARKVQRRIFVHPTFLLTNSKLGLHIVDHR